MKNTEWKERVMKYLSTYEEVTDEDSCVNYIYGQLNKGAQVDEVLDTFCDNNQGCDCDLYRTIERLKDRRLVEVLIMEPDGVDVEDFKARVERGLDKVGIAVVDIVVK